LGDDDTTDDDKKILERYVYKIDGKKPQLLLV